MRLSLPALVLTFSALSSATFFWSEADDQFAAGEPKTIEWSISDFDANVDIYVGDEDADEDSDDGKGKKIASDVPNVGTFTWVPDKSDVATKKKKIWGKDKKGKKNKGRKLIEIIIGIPGKNKKSTTETHPPQQTAPQQTLPPGTTLTSIATLTSIIPTHVTATQTIITTKPGDGKDKDKKKHQTQNPTTTIVPVPVPVPTHIVTPLLPAPEQPPTTIITSKPPVLITGTPSFPSGNGTVIVPTATTGTGIPLFTNVAAARDAKPVLVGGLAGLLVLGML